MERLIKASWMILLFAISIGSANAQNEYKRTFAKKVPWKKVSQYDLDNNRKLSDEELSKMELPVFDSGGKSRLNIKYKQTPTEDLYMDVFYPAGIENPEKLPVVVYTHGGGWFLGSKENINKGLELTTFQELAKDFVIVSINYRLVRGRNLSMRDCIVDGMDALRYLTKNEEDLGIDANNIFLLGDSAGGHIAQMLTLADPALFPGDKSLKKYGYNIVATVSWYGPSDFTEIKLFETSDPSKNPDRFYNRIMSKSDPSGLKEKRFREMSPVYYLKKSSPPIYMMAAENDTTIPVAHAYHMKEKADELGANVELLVVKNAGHNWRKAGGELSPTPDEIVVKSVGFLRKHLNIN